MGIFWDTIAEYNLATWPFQLLFIAVAAVLAAFLFFRPAAWAKVAAKLLMVTESLWIAFVYYMKYGGVREYSSVMTIFWCLVAVAWIYDLVTHYSTFQRSGKYEWLGILMMLMSLCYPLISVARGMSFPYIATPMIPSAVSLFMLGMLMTFNKKINFFAFIFIVHWSIIAISKIIFLGMPEDALLATACVPAIYIFFKDAIDAGESGGKPSATVVKGLVMTIAVAIGACMLIEVCLN